MLNTLRREYHYNKQLPQQKLPTKSDEKLRYAIRLKESGRPEEAILVLKTIATDECPKAQYHPGCMLADGIGITRDSERGRNCF